MLENPQPHHIKSLVYRDISFNQNTIQRPPPLERLKCYIKAATGCGGSPTAMNRRRETVKVELWAGVTQRGQRLMIWWGGDRKPHMKSMKPRASRRLHIKRCKPP